MMPPISERRRSSGRVYAKAGVTKQVHFPPRTRKVSTRDYPSSTRKTRQQTLTQIDFVSRIVPDEENLDLEPIKLEEVGIEEKSPQRKRRKTVHGLPTSRVQTRAARREALKQEEYENNSEEQARNWVQNDSSPPVKATMQPPSTPKRYMKREIPSSSPLNGPLSTQSRRSISRSPLKEKSSNMWSLQLPYLSTEKAIYQAPKLEVRDTYGSENMCSEISTQAPSPSINILDSAISLKQTSTETTSARQSSDENLRRMISQASKENSPITKPSGRYNLPISDSDEENDTDDSENEEFKIGLETQAIFAETTSTSTHDPLSEADYPSTTPKNSNIPPNISHQSLISKHNTFFSPPSNTVLTRILQSPSPSPSPPPHLQQSLSEEASAQPTSDLSRSTQAPPLPPSQATTVDITQLRSSSPIPRTKYPPSKTLQHKEPPLSPPPPPQQQQQQQQQHSYSPTVIIPLSSPLDSITLSSSQHDVYEYEYNGERLTDSQMLPDSLMQDTIVEAPVWEDGEWELES